MKFVVNSHIPEGLPLRSVYGTGRDEGSSLVASLAAWSTMSLPFIPTWLKSNKNGWF